MRAREITTGKEYDAEPFDYCGHKVWQVLLFVPTTDRDKTGFTGLFPDWEFWQRFVQVATLEPQR
jgi:hypothetical protein